MENQYAFTFDDISLVPAYSEILPSETDISVNLGEKLHLTMPIISAAMDTVTENQMARVMAQRGGIGVIHKNMSISSQVKEVEKVKKYESGMILDPISLSPDDLLERAHEIMKAYSISGVPVTVNKQLVGIITNRDLRFETDLHQALHKFMTGKEKLVTAKKNISLEEAKKILHRHRIEKLPVVDDDFCLIGLITIKDIEKATAFPSANKDKHGRLFVGAAVGTSEETKERISALIKAEVDLICVDTAHGHSKKVLETVSYIKKSYPNCIIMAGNVATAEGTSDLIKAGSDIVKVGIGPGSICTTRIISGVGIPQISAVIECSKIAKKKGAGIVADGGIKYSGDIVKALALGANAVMLGSLLAGSDESPGEIVLYRGRTYKVYRGMGSLSAMKKGSKDRYSQEEIIDISKLVPEGIEGKVPYRGSVSAQLDQLSGGLRAGLGYTGSKDISSLQKNVKFVQLSSQSLKESHVHDVTITKEAPNYRLE
ncbi:MAG: IMP dehydrogenase [Bdellovibrionaceae bacterium]|nr:IMP dehydrogenase [Pseudobdellovibrionaceae bacterium]